MRRVTLRLRVLDVKRVIDGMLGAERPKECLPDAHELLARVSDEIDKPVDGLEVFTKGRRILANGSRVLAVAAVDLAQSVILVDRDGERDRYVTANVYAHEGDGEADLREWDHGHYFSDLGEARRDFAKRVGLVS